MINIKNVAAVYYWSKLFRLFSLSELSLGFIERWFPSVAKSKNFLELDFISVAKVFSSNELNLDSELEVVHSAERWLHHKHTERCKHAKDILLKIRLSLLSVPALNHVLNRKSYLVKIGECAGIIKEVVRSKENFVSSRTASSGNRYCSQNNFSIVVCGGEEYQCESNGEEHQRLVNDAHIVDCNLSYGTKALPQMLEGRQYAEVVCVGDQVYVFGGIEDLYGDSIMSVEKYSSGTWKSVSVMYEDRRHFCACSFMGNVFVFAGILDFDFSGATDSCVKFNTKSCKWTKVARMNEPRFNAACAVFDGKIFVSGGDNTRVILNTVEAFDHVARTWSVMPDMIERRENHKSVAIKNKLFVVGGLYTRTLEVFDSTCNKFVLLNPHLPSNEDFDFLSEVISIGSKLVVVICDFFCGTIMVYDVENDEWSEEPFEVSGVLLGSSCAKLPQL